MGLLLDPHPTPCQVADLMLLAQRVAARLEPHYHADAATVAIQDGGAAGQTVRA
jgi:diadenosine tetraphosphate (Ap4A) HIT family hydrolase